MRSCGMCISRFGGHSYRYNSDPTAPYLNRQCSWSLGSSRSIVLPRKRRYEKRREVIKPLESTLSLRDNGHGQMSTEDDGPHDWFRTSCRGHRESDSTTWRSFWADTSTFVLTSLGYASCLCSKTYSARRLLTTRTTSPILFVGRSVNTG